MEKDLEAEDTQATDLGREGPATPTRSTGHQRRGLRRLGLLIAYPIAVALDLLALGALGAGAFVAVALTELPSTDVLRDARLQEPLRVYTAEGLLMAEYGVQRRIPVAFREVPPRLVNAFLATEDSRFFEHEGIDLTGIGRAAVNYLQTGDRSQGGSTITMQVARNFFLSREKTFQRKISELLLALHIERTLTKEEILELYLNKIFFGHRAYGVSAAAALYYDKPLDRLDLAEMAMLAGIPKAPTSNNPVSNPERARARRDFILGRMRDLGYIEDEELAAAIAEPDEAQLHRKEVDLEAGYAAEMVRREMVERFGEDAYGAGYRVTTTVEGWLQTAAQESVRKAIVSYDRRHGYRGPEVRHEVRGLEDADLDALLAAAGALPGLTGGIVLRAGAEAAEVYIGDGQRISLGASQLNWARRFKNATWRANAPRKATDAVAAGDLVRLQKTKDDTWRLSQAPGVSGALVAVSPLDGGVRALVGGYYFDDSKFNRAVDARRQPGSSFKPFVYAAALDKGWTPASLVKDERISVRLSRRRMWTPENADRKTMGPIRLRTALTLSRNLASIHLLQQVGLDDARDFVGRFGFSLEELPLGLSMALGTAEVSPLQMAGAYSVFANGGFRVHPYLISRVENGAGELVYQATPARACENCWFRYQESTADTASLNREDSASAERVLDPRLVFQMDSMMGDVIRYGTGRKALKLKRKDIAGKTGTTNDVRDSWFCGYQKDLAAIAWMGYDDSSPLGRGETGGQAGLGMWVDFMGQALKDKATAILEVPPGMVQLRIDKARGTPSKSKGGGTIVEWIRQEYAQATQGPKPVRYAGGDKGPVRKAARKAAPAQKPSASSTPRVMDDLF